MCSRPAVSMTHDDRAQPLRLHEAVLDDLARVALTLLEDVEVELRSELLELLDRRGAVHVRRDQERAVAPTPHVHGQLGRGGWFCQRPAARSA